MTEFRRIFAKPDVRCGHASRQMEPDRNRSDGKNGVAAQAKRVAEKTRSQRFGRVSGPLLFAAKPTRSGTRSPRFMLSRTSPTKPSSGYTELKPNRDSALTLTKVDPVLKSLRHDPRYTELLKKLNLPT
jgi:hypothetical protein